MTTASTPLLSVEGLHVSFHTRRGRVEALTGVDLEVPRGSIQVVIGESGSGKSVLAHTLLGLLPGNVDVRGTARLHGEHLLTADPRRLRQLRAHQLALVPQSPATALNPVRRIGRALHEAASVKGIPPRQRDGRIRAVTGSVGLEYDDVASRYPHQLSGGMQRRVINSMALLGTPDLVIADEPTTGLDRDRVGDVARELRRLTDTGAGVLVITHDLTLAAELGGRTAVLYGGHLTEVRPTATLLDHPRHPYTTALLAALPERGLHPIPGQSPEMTDPGDGCPFAPRCQLVLPECHDLTPGRTYLPDGEVRCHAAR